MIHIETKQAEVTRANAIYNNGFWRDIKVGYIESYQC